MEVLKAVGSLRLCGLRFGSVSCVDDFDVWNSADEEASESDAEESAAEDTEGGEGLIFCEGLSLPGGELSASDSSCEMGLNSGSEAEGDEDGEE